ncbi:TetR/AcrR family transcriptional regulator [Cellulosimicrobium protaetiae]|uniref:TetR/AcrR family transcriptional regulator n=1 Tax=Cellulosimicrobium protaetiae TaxID=2587808 RepID=A0A6M5ULF9_9MICO|nr:TetR/AcrR family transcriptional regulator [Cellulosimicrobium protaetiae]QJW37968.1 TetR/AcrR family transcriptional regulator [Cellulosimicrobium protaetiae]
MTSVAIGAGQESADRRRAAGEPGRGYAKGRAKREEILQASIVLFGEVGYHAASLREIASRVGMSHPGLLHHFPTKVALLEAVLDHRDTVDQADLAADLARGTDYFDALVSLVERNGQRRHVVELFTALVAEATSPDHPAHAHFVRRYEWAVGRTGEQLARRAREGGLREGVDPAATARHVIALMDGLQVQWLLALDRPEPERVDMAADLRAYLRLVLVD